MDRRERYARIVCIASGQKPDHTWPPVPTQEGEAPAKPLWTFHLPAADAVLAQADSDIKEHGGIP